MFNNFTKKSFQLSFILSAFIFTGCGGESKSSNTFPTASPSGALSKDTTPTNITLSKDTIHPNITLTGDNLIRVDIGGSYIDLGATAVDDIDGDITNSIIVSANSIDTSVAGKHNIKYSVSDTAGNRSSVKRKVIVRKKIEAITNNTNIIINEVLTRNINTNIDPDFGKFSDWIELYNSGDNAIDIGGFYLSDDTTKPKMWKIPNSTVIASHSYLLIWADDKDKNLKALHTNFKLSQKGDSLTLANKDGDVVDFIEFPKQNSDISYSKGDKVGYTMPTPESKNTQSYEKAKLSKEAIFSFDNNAQILTISQENEASIYYTTDGSTPTKNSTLYTQPININKTTVVKARALEEGKFFSTVQHKTYFINHKSTLPIVSLSTDSKYLFDDKIGIYTTGTNGVPLLQCRRTETENKNYAREWSRPIHIEYLDNTYAPQFSIDLDFSITGQCSRHYAKKSFSFDLDSKYGTKSLKYKLFNNKDVIKFKSFKLRTGDNRNTKINIENDDYGNQMSDILAASFVEVGNLDVDYQAYQAVQMFMNGEYWGVYNLREKKGKDYLRSNYPNLGKKMDIISTSIKLGNRKDYDNLRSYVKSHDLSIANNYTEVLNKVDENSFIDYMSIMIYSANTDWLDSNFRCWKEKKDGAKWRWMLDDLDYGFINKNVNQNTFDVVSNNPSSLMTSLFIKLSKNNTFKTKFKKRFNELLDTLFEPNNAQRIIDKIINERKEYMSLENKWGIKLIDFEFNSDLIRSFIKHRNSIIKQQLNTF